MNISANILKFYLYQIFWSFWLVAAIDVVFYQQNGISVIQIAGINSLWAVVAFFLEVPTGVLADRWSRKYMLVISGLCASIGFLIFSLNSAFLPFAIATIFMAARFSFASGTANALLYDSLKMLKREAEFEKILGTSRFYAITATVAATIIGSYLAASNIRLPYIITSIISFGAALIAFLFVEPKLHKSTGEVKLFTHLKESFLYTLKQSIIRDIILYLVCVDIVLGILDEYDQLYLLAISFPLVFFGAWIGVRRGLGGLAGYFAHYFKSYTPYVEPVSLLVILVGVLSIALGHPVVGLSAFIIIFALWGIADVLIMGKLHREVPSHRRATIESFKVFLASFLNIPVLLIFGYISDHFGIRSGYLFSASLVGIYSVYFLYQKMRT